MSKVIISRTMTDLEWLGKVAEATVARGADLTSAYGDWVRVGFALVNEFGAEGEDLFVEFSRPYHGFDEAECRGKYKKLLTGEESWNGERVSIGTIVEMAKGAGVEIPRKTVRSLVEESDAAGKEAIGNAEGMESLDEEEQIASISDSTVEGMPRLMREIISRSEKKTERDMMVFGGIVALSVAMPKVEGIYDKNRVFPNLYMMTVGAASSGKGRLNMLRYILTPIHREKRMQYEEQMKEYKKNKRGFMLDKSGNIDEPTEPGQRMLFSPANSSSAAFNEYICYNEDGLMILETEGDTVANAFKSDFGDYSVILRKAFHHEYDSLGRKTNREYHEAESPKVSIIVSGTPGQAAKIFPSAENGLLSRFLFYYLALDLEWKDVWGEDGEEPMEQTFRKIGDNVYGMYCKLKQRMLPIVFELTREQKRASTNYFKGVMKEYYYLYGEEMISPLHRLGLIQFRIAMVLSVLRYMESEGALPVVMDKLGQACGVRLECQEADFRASMELTDVALHHAARVFQMLPKEPVTRRNRMEERVSLMYQKLPREFKTADANKIGDGLTLSENIVKRLLLRMEKEGKIVRGIINGHWKKR